MEISRMFLTLAVGTIGGFAGYKLKIPAGAMIGSLLAVAVFNMLYGSLVKLPGSVMVGVQIVLGTALGMTITKSVLADLKIAWLPALIIAGTYLLAGIGVGFLVSKVTGWNLLTSIFSAMPGGLTDVVAAAQSVEGVKSVDIIVVQTVRLVTVILSIPILVKLLGK